MWHFAVQGVTRKAVLLLIDDVWDAKQLTAMQLTSQFAPGSMVIVTSRSRWEVLRTALEITGLGPGPATELFVSSASIPFPSLVGNIYELVVDIVANCKGMPLMIEIAGSSLQTKLDDLQVWQVATGMVVLV